MIIQIKHFLKLQRHYYSVIFHSLQTFLFLGNLTLTMVVSLVVTLAFEVPFLEMEKVFLPKKKAS